MIFLSVCSNDTCLFDHSGDIVHINIFTFARVEPMNAVCAPRTATMMPLTTLLLMHPPKKDAQVPYITSPDAAITTYRGCLSYTYDLSKKEILSKTWALKNVRR